MSRVGVVCASPLKRGGSLLSDEECLSCANRGDNSCGLAPAYLTKVLEPHTSSGALGVSYLASSCLRKVKLQRDLNYFENPADMQAAFFGSAVHEQLAASKPEGCETEVTYWALNPFDQESYIVARVDIIDLARGILTDYKTCDEFSRAVQHGYPHDADRRQVQYQRWVIDNAVGVGDEPPVVGDDGLWAPSPEWDDPRLFQPLGWSELRVHYLSRREQKSVRITKKDPDGGRYRVPDIWSDEQVLEDMGPRYWALKGGEVPAPPEGWEYLSGPFCGKCPLRMECARRQMEEAA